MKWTLDVACCTWAMVLDPPPQIDQLSAIEVLLRALRGPPTRARLLVLRLALSVAIQKQSGLVQESDFDEARQLLRRLDLVANHQTLVQYEPVMLSGIKFQD